MSAITPPKTGNFPPGFWREMEAKGIGLTYGDPGWVQRISELKKTAVPIQSKFALPVILGSYDGESGTYDSDTFQDLLFGPNPTGSLTDYYNEVSYGLFSLSGTVYGWYGSSILKSDAVEDPRTFVRSLAELADGDIDFSLYDNDGEDGIPNSGDDDGFVDGIAVVYSGGTSGSIWPHMWTLGTNPYTTNDVGASGDFILVSSYMICPEQTGGSIEQIGVFAHEFGHLLGLPDLYDRTDDTEGPDYDASRGLGNWCLMASGSYGGDGQHEEKPAHMSAWCKIEMGWIAPTLLSEDQSSVAFPDVETSQFCMKVF